jgi:uncharacterized protein YndB with AHSA1/START domain
MTSDQGEPADARSTRSVRVRRALDASPERTFRAWADPDELARWFPQRVEGSLSVGSRTHLVWPSERLWWDVVEADPNRRFRFRWPWLDGRLVTAVTVQITPRGYGTLVELDDGPFDLRDPDGLDAFAECCEGWGEALTLLRARLDFDVDVRPRR